MASPREAVTKGLRSPIQRYQAQSPRRGESPKRRRSERFKTTGSLVEDKPIDATLSKGRTREPDIQRHPAQPEHRQKRRRFACQIDNLPQPNPHPRKRRQAEQSGCETRLHKRRRPLPPAAEQNSRSITSQSSYVAEWVLGQTRLDELPESIAMDNMPLHRVAEKRSSSLRRKRSSSSIAASATPSDQKSREGKSAAYSRKGYDSLLRKQGVSIDSELSISDESDAFCQSLRNTTCKIPDDTLLGDNVYREAIADLRGRNESRVIQDVGRLFVPSIQTLAKVSETRFRVFVESVDEGWDCSYPLTDPRPQPDYAVGFGRSGLSESRINKLQPLVQDDPTFLSDFTATHYMYFPFFTSEVKCGTAGLETADRQNAHSMGIAVRAIVAIFRLAGRENELHNKVVAYSFSHNHRSVQINGWGPNIQNHSFTVHPVSISSFDITNEKGLERWTPRKISFGIYEYGLTLLERIKTIIDELPPDLNLESVQPLRMGLNTGLHSRSLNRSGLSQVFDTQSLSEAPSEIPDNHSTPATTAEVSSPKRKK